jgi:hypothetical protein
VKRDVLASITEANDDEVVVVVDVVVVVVVVKRYLWWRCRHNFRLIFCARLSAPLVFI